MNARVQRDGPAPLVKICGITNAEDAEAAIARGADALGFNLCRGSKRFTPLAEFAAWVPALRGRVTRVAVMVNPTEEEAMRAAESFDVVQLHGEETPAFCARLSTVTPVWKAWPLSAELTAARVSEFPVDGWVIDAFVPGSFGGTGKLIDLERAADFIQAFPGKRIWLSGGLNAENVADAIQRTRPYGVDVASGVEVDGDARRKDAARLRAFITAARVGQG